MKIKYLGTAAYEGVPALYCKCRVCTESFRTGGRALRSRSQALIDESLLIDYNADTVCHSLRYRIDWEKIGDCLITHSHSDHLCPADLEILSDPISHEHRTLHFYSAQDGYEKIAEQIALHKMQNRATVTLVRHGDLFYTSQKKYKILVLRAAALSRRRKLRFSAACQSNPPALLRYVSSSQKSLRRKSFSGTLLI